MELKDVQNWSYNELDKAINFSKNSIVSDEKEIARLELDITNLESDIKMLREVKSQKTMADSLGMITDFGIDFSLEDLQAFLSDRRNVVTKIAEENPKEISKTDFLAETKNLEPEISQSDEVVQSNDAEKENEESVTESVEQNLSTTADEILNNSSAEAFEELEGENEKMLRTIKENLGLPEDATLAEAKSKLEANRNILPPAWFNHFEDIIGKVERGEFEPN